MNNTDIPCPSKPLTMPHYEAFAQSLANGAGPSKAYRAHIAEPGTSRTSIKAAAYKVARIPYVAQRIEYLRGVINEKVRENERELTGADLSALMLEVTHIFESAIQTAESSCLASRPEMQRMRDRLVLHLGRVGRSIETVDSDADKSPGSLIPAPAYCTCEADHGA